MRRMKIENVTRNVTVPFAGFAAEQGALTSATVRKGEGRIYEVTYTAADGTLRGLEVLAGAQVWVENATASTAPAGTQTCTGACATEKPLRAFPTTKMVAGVMGRGTECRACRDARYAAGDVRSARGRSVRAQAKVDALMARLEGRGTLLVRETTAA